MTEREALSEHIVNLLINNACMSEKIKEQDIKIAGYENAFNHILFVLGQNRKVPKSVLSQVTDIINRV